MNLNFCRMPFIKEVHAVCTCLYTSVVLTMHPYSPLLLSCGDVILTPHVTAGVTVASM